MSYNEHTRQKSGPLFAVHSEAFLPASPNDTVYLLAKSVHRTVLARVYRIVNRHQQSYRRFAKDRLGRTGCSLDDDGGCWEIYSRFRSLDPGPAAGCTGIHNYDGPGPSHCPTSVQKEYLNP